MEKKFYNLTNPQKNIWNMEQYYPKSSINNITGRTFIDEVVDFSCLENAINLYVKQNDATRIKVILKDDIPSQFIDDYSFFSVPTVELSNISEIDSLSHKIINTPIEIINSNLFSFTMYKLPDGKGGFYASFHHLISDAWSMGLLGSIIMNYYSYFKKNTEVKLDENYSYVDYIHSEETYLSSDKFNKDCDFWTSLYDFEPELCEISSLKSSVLSTKAKRKAFHLSSDLYLNILDFCKHNGCSIYSFFMSIYLLYLSKINNIDTPVIGSPILNRGNFKEKNTCGMFVSTVPFMVKLNKNDTFKDFLQNTCNIQKSIFRHQKYPYDILLKDLKSRYSIKENLYDVAFSYQNARDNSSECATKYSSDWIFSNNISDTLQIHFYDMDNTGLINIYYDYQVNKLSDLDINNIHSSILNIVSQVLQNVSIQLSNIEIICPEEKKCILNSDNIMNYPINQSIISIFEEKSNQQPDEIALIHGNTKVSYSQLNRSINQLTDFLLQNGVKKGDIIATFIDRSPSLIIAMLAIMKSGAVYLPLSKSLPMDRITYILKDSNAKLVISTSSSSLTFNNILNIDTFVFEKYNSELKVDYTLPDDTIYTIYTSGSTGQPKGVQVTNKNLNNFIHSFNKLYNNNVSSKDICLATTNISFDVSIWEFFFTLLNGASLYLYEENTISDIVKYCSCIIQNKITMLYIPPNILDSVFEILAMNDNDNILINKLLVGVEPIKVTTIKKYFSLNPSMQIVNGYGPTETTICATAFVVTPDNLADFSTIPIGKPLHNLKGYIVNKDFQLLPIGYTGELCIEGDNVSKGYLSNTELTNKKFVTSPFSFNKIVYRTGDLVKMLPDGNLMFVGRNDHQVKIRGHRIELGEITSAISSYPEIRKCVINLRNNNTVIVAFFTASRPISTRELRGYLYKKLPLYCIPNFFIQLDDFKLTPNGKIDQKYLDTLEVDIKNNFVAPQTSLQRKLVSIWEKVLNISHIGIDDNFFSIGGDSLAAISIQTEALKYEIDISYSDIFDFPTVRLLSEKKEISRSCKNFSDYDYSAINRLLSTNAIENICEENNSPISPSSNILLLGSTGFLGSHILDKYLSNTNGIAYCLVRNKLSTNYLQRLKSTLNFYFGNKYDSYIGNRIKVVYGDIVKKDLGLDEKLYNTIGNSISAVINSAALVKHFGEVEKFQNINVKGTQNIIEFCKAFNVKLYHISTISVYGTDTLTPTTEEIDRPIYKETDFNINQKLNNIYISTKYEAEKIIYEEISTGLKACVLRIGNIFNRFSDYKFQINPSDNALLNRIKSIIKLGVIDDNFSKHSLDFTPVDDCAEAIVKIFINNPNFTVFHLINPYFISFKIIISVLCSSGHTVKFVPAQEFSKKINTFLSNSSLKSDISGLIPDIDKSRILNIIPLPLPSVDFTVKYLSSIGFNWSKVDDNYVLNCLYYFMNIGFI